MNRLFLPVFLLFSVRTLFAANHLSVGNPGGADQVLERVGFALGYSETHEQAIWVQYRLTAKQNRTRRAERLDEFFEDPAIQTGSAQLSDYSGSGYHRGHLAPAADMKYSPVAMRESFLLSNITPQHPEFDSGIWVDLEKFVRYTVNVEQAVTVITGPIFTSSDSTIGANQVTVPSAYYKVIYDETPPRKMIGFILPHKPSDAPIVTFAVPVDEVERRTSLDFFSKVPDADTLEATIDTHAWKKLLQWERQN